jgi:hypothetical protein
MAMYRINQVCKPMRGGDVQDARTHRGSAWFGVEPSGKKADMYVDYRKYIVIYFIATDSHPKL